MEQFCSSVWELMNNDFIDLANISIVILYIY